MTVSVSVDGKREFSDKMQSYQKKVHKGIGDAVKRSTLLVHNTATKETSKPGSGIAYTRGGKTHRASSPGDPPAKDTGNLSNSIIFKVSPSSGEVIARAPYAKYLEFGLGIDARPFMEPAFIASLDKINAFFRNAL